MHAEAYRAMSDMLPPSLVGQLILDVGSLDVNGTYRPLVEGRGGRYTGLDVRAGPNVDVVAAQPYRYPLADGAFDCVISGSTMEHVAHPWRWLPELARLLKPGGLLCIVTHWSFPEHRYPLDCWRVLPDGMAALLDECGCWDTYEIEVINEHDITARAVKYPAVLPDQAAGA